MDLERSESEVNFLKSRERTKSDGDVPRQLFLPFSSRFQVSSSFKFHVFLLFQPFLNVCYFTFLTPFRFTRDPKGYYNLQTNPVQQILSTLVLSLCTIYALLDLRYFLEQNLKENPHKAFVYAYGLLKGFIPFVWLVTFWFKRKWFAKLLTVCQGKAEEKFILGKFNNNNNSTNTPSLTLQIIVHILVILTLAKVIFEFLNSFQGIENLLAYKAGILLYNFHLKQDDAQLEQEDLWESPLLICLASVTAFISTTFNYIEYMFDLFCFIGAAMVFAVCGHFSDEMEKLSRMSSAPENCSLQSKRILKLMQTNYVDLIAILDSINEVFGSLIVLYFLGSYPTLVWSVFGLFRKVSISYGIFHVHKICIFVLVTVTAAEGNSKVGQFKQWLFHTSVSSAEESGSGVLSGIGAGRSIINIDDMDYYPCDDGLTPQCIDLSSLNILHREVSTETLGLKGYKFFTVTHGLIGTMLGIVVTFAIVMLQFEMDIDDNPRRPSGSRFTVPMSFAKESAVNTSQIDTIF
ncbi:unnamed protein product [Orchesella dallaii]|uniref:Gustatory receptor n=1 Tax=Orchesella dallaii TaxID=48710 RepID=A0ABP1RZE7_9HEXA